MCTSDSFPMGGHKWSLMLNVTYITKDLSLTLRTNCDAGGKNWEVYLLEERHWQSDRKRRISVKFLLRLTRATKVTFERNLQVSPASEFHVWWVPTLCQAFLLGCSLGYNQVIKRQIALCDIALWWSNTVLLGQKHKSTSEPCLRQSARHELTKTKACPF